jgi:hypothetical protein
MQHSPLFDYTISAGTVLGVLGFILSIINFLRQNHIAKANLLREALLDDARLRTAAAGLGDLVQQARRSRHNLLAGKGLFHSGVRTLFDEELVTDLPSVARLREQVANIDREQLKRLSFGGLSTRLTWIRTLQQQLDGILEKYTACLATDDRDREQLAAERVAMRTAARKEES